MNDPNGFLKYKRELPNRRSIKSRIKDSKEIERSFSEEKINQQSARCMDCGVPFCHSGCPLGNDIPAFNEAVYNEDWKKAFSILSSTNNFPEFTGRICPAPCEQACVLGINSDPVTIEQIEKTIAEKAFANHWVQPNQSKATGKKIAVIGSGPTGLAAADELNKAGHEVVVFERDEEAGGLLRYGIPDFKLAKNVVKRRIEIMKASGVLFEMNTEIGNTIAADEIITKYDAVILAIGATVPRSLPIPGSNLPGVHFAMDFLKQQNHRVSGKNIPFDERILATNKEVCVIGGGDTGADCLGTAHRQNAKSVTQIELMSKPPNYRDESTPWPLWPMQLRESSSHEEGGKRLWAIQTKAFIAGKYGKLCGVQLVDIEWKKNATQHRYSFTEIANTERIIPCELALLAIGFSHPQHEGLINQLKLDLTKKGNISDKDYRTTQEKVFVAGDARRGQSLVVWAIAEGREVAIRVNNFLKGATKLRSNYQSVLEV